MENDQNAKNSYLIERVSKDSSFDVSGAIAALGIGQAGEIFRSTLKRWGPDSLEIVRRGAEAVRRSLAADGVTPGAVAAFLRKNPHGQLQTEFPEVARIVERVEVTVRRQRFDASAMNLAAAEQPRADFVNRSEAQQTEVAE